MPVGRRTSLAVVVATAAALLTGCGATRPDGPSTSPAPVSTSTAIALPVPSNARLVGSWAVVAMPLQRSPVDKRRGFDLELQDDQLVVATSDGCNAQRGGLAVTDAGAVTLGGLTSTLGACAGQTSDTRHTDALYSARTVGLDDRAGLDQLVFRDGAERIVLVLQRIPPLSMGALLGTWAVVALGDGSAPTVPLTTTFALDGTQGTVATGDGCSTVVGRVELSGQYGLRFDQLTPGRRPCAGRTDDRLVRGLTQVRTAAPDLTSDPQRITLVSRAGLQIVVLERRT